ncbi:arginyl-tRNA synthetase [Nematocida sp. AWRm80]|nr:arginyl-tRNA synthetase [Nematocida sp. AWRm80]
MERIKKDIVDVISQCTKFEKDKIKKAVMKSRNIKNGDFMIPFSQLTRDPEIIKIVEKYFNDNMPKTIERIEVNGQMIFVFCNTKEVCKEILAEILIKGESYGDGKEGQGKCVVIDFSSPNIAKVFHAGHLRTTLIGNYVKNIYQKMGYKTVGINYLGDWGKQFGILGVGYQNATDKEEMNIDPIEYLNKVYVRTSKQAEEDPSIHDKAREFFKQMEEGDESALKIWRLFRELSVKRYKKLYNELGIHFDEYSGESFYGKAALKVKTKPYAIHCEDGSYIADLGEGLNKVVLIQSNGTSLYLARDIAAAEDRIDKYNPHKLIYVVASQQNLHFKQLFKMLEIDGKDPNMFLHINYGMVLGMSTRKGTAVFLSDIISTAQEAVMEVMKASGKIDKVEYKEHTSFVLAMSTIIIQDFKAKRCKDYEFDMAKNTSFIGDTGPYIQYTCCRLAGISRNAIYPVGNLNDLEFSHLVDPKCYELTLSLSRYPEILAESIKGHEPSTIVTYILHLCKLVNSIFKIIWVTNQPDKIARPRLAMYEATRIVLCSAMKVLGMEPLDRM